MVSSPLVRFSSPGAAAETVQYPDGFVLKGAACDLLSRSPCAPLGFNSTDRCMCDSTTHREGASTNNSSSPVSVTTFSFSQWKTLTPRSRDINELCEQERDDFGDVFVDHGSDDLCVWQAGKDQTELCSLAEQVFTQSGSRQQDPGASCQLQSDLQTQKDDVAMMRQAVMAKEREVSCFRWSGFRHAGAR
jgi:hypothetical protein